MKAFGALEIALRSRTLRFRLRTVRPLDGPLPLGRDVHRSEQEVALANDFAFLKVHALQVARNARTHFHGMDGFQAARELISVRLFACR